jgi:hypothetical protein
MKNLRTYVLCAALIACCTNVFGQDKSIPVNEPNYNKPRLFTALPDQIPVTADELDNLFNTAAARPASLKLPLSADTQFEGEISSLSERTAEGLQKMVIRSTNFNGAHFSVSRIPKADGSVIYRGRIISFGHGDAYELQYRNGQLQFVKRNYYDMINE